MSAITTDVSAFEAQPAASAPLTKKDRILFLDALRGIALLGILVMNITAQGQAHVFYAFLDTRQPITGPNYWVWIMEMVFFEGTMRGTFSILFGAGTLLLIDRLEKSRSHIDAADIYYRRVLWLLLFGLINAFIFLWPGDILYFYALCGLVLFPFRKLSPNMLLVGIVIMLAFGLYRDNVALYERKEIITKGKQVEALQKQHKKLNEDQKADLEKWKGFREKNTTQGIIKQGDEDIKKVKDASYAQIFSYYKSVNMELESIGFYNGWWDMLIFFFIGMAFYKNGFLTGNSPTWVYALVAVLGIGLALAFNFIGVHEMYKARFDNVKLTESNPAELYQIRRVIQTIGYLSLFVLLYKLSFMRSIFHIFVPVGQMAFTNYLSQSIITSIFFYGFAYYAKLQRYQLYEVVAGVWVFQIIFSHVWLRYFMFGPFEWLWRSLTYSKIQPMLKPRPEVPVEMVSATVANL